MRSYFFAFFFITALPLSAADYVVSPKGNDKNPGTSEKPWRTVQRAALKLQAGDRVFICAGIYKEKIRSAHSGTKDKPIIYQAFPGERPVIDGKDVKLPEWTGLFLVQGLSYIQIRGLTIQNAGPYDGDAGLMVDKSDHIVIEGLRTYNTKSSGIGVWKSREVLVEGNEVELACNDGSQECISIAQTDGFEVRDNEVHHGGPGNHGAEGIDIKDGSCHGTVHHNHVHHMNRVAIYVDVWNKPTHDIEVFDNVVHDNTRDGIDLAAENGGVLERVKVHDNLVYRNGHNGMTFAAWGENVPHHVIQDLEVFNNTFWRNGTAKWGGGILFENKEAKSIKVHDNILSDNHSFQIAVDVKPVSAKISRNLIHGFRGYENETRGADFLEADPLFKDPATGDFHLLSTSPAKGYGSRGLK